MMPSGVSSPVRAFHSVGGTPYVVAAATGAEVRDEDGRRYIDFVGSWGPLILGHAHPRVIEAVEGALRLGTTYGAPCRAEIELAEEVAGSYPGIEQVRFVSSGTEATMSAIRLARGATGRDLVVKFSGCYHGHVDHLLVASGSGLATFGVASSAGVPAEFTRLTRVLPLDDEGAVRSLFATDGTRIAAAIIEPVPANNGLLIQRREFLKTLRDLCAQYGALLIFDEVITGFRLGPGGAAARYDITPDLVTFGKVIGGGLPVGAFAGPRTLMRALVPEGGVYQAGTLSGNPIAMTAGLTTLRLLKEEGLWGRLDELGVYLEEVLEDVIRTSRLRARLVRLSSIFWIAWHAQEPPRSAEAIDRRSAGLYARVFHALLWRGIALAPSAYEVGFLCAAHTRAHIDHLGTALGEALAGIARDGSTGDTHVLQA